MDKLKFEEWLEEKIKDCTEYKAKDQTNRAFMLGATASLSEILDAVRKGKFNEKE